MSPEGNGIRISDDFKVLEISQDVYRDKKKKYHITVSVSYYPAKNN